MHSPSPSPFYRALPLLVYTAAVFGFCLFVFGVCVSVHVHTCAYTCGYQKPTSTVILQTQTCRNPSMPAPPRARIIDMYRHTWPSCGVFSLRVCEWKQRMQNRGRGTLGVFLGSSDKG